MTTKALSAKELEDIGALLKQQRNALSEHLRGGLHVDANDEVRATPETDADWTTATSEADAALLRVEHDATELAAYDRAIKKHKTSEFGQCETCGTQIGYARLLAHPTAERCLACQTRAESRHFASTTGAERRHN